MSDLMLLGVLRMRIDLWSDSAIDKIQRYGRYLQAANEIVSLREQLTKVTAERDALNYRLAKRDLEQQAKALEEFKIPELSYTAFQKVGDALIEQVEALRKRANEVSK